MNVDNYVKEKIIKIKANLFIKNPYLGMIVNSVDYEFSNDIHTIATDGKKIIINPNFAYQYIDVLEYLIIHEALHIIFLHNFVNKRFNNINDMVLLNIAEDIVINEYILKEFNFRFYNGVYKENFEELRGKDVVKMTSLEVYEILRSNKKADGFSKCVSNSFSLEDNNSTEDKDGKKEDGKDNDNDGNENYAEDYGLSKKYAENVKDEIKYKLKIVNSKAEEKEKLVKDIKESLSKIVGLEKMVGNLSGLLSNLIEKQIYAKTINWRVLLREELKEMVKNEITYRLINKKIPILRNLDINIANLPTFTNGSSKSKLVILIDVSGSISDTEYALFIGEIEKIVKTIRCEGEVITFDVEIINKYLLRNGFANIVLKSLKNRVGYGGTDVSEALTYASKHHKGAYLVMLTDGYVSGFSSDFVKKFKKFIVVLTPKGTTEYFGDSKGIKFIRMEVDGDSYE